MSTTIITLIIAFILTILALASLSISWLIKGKSRLEKGACGRNPHEKKDNCGKNFKCSLCDTKSSETNTKNNVEDSARDEET